MKKLLYILLIAISIKGYAQKYELTFAIFNSKTMPNGVFLQDPYLVTSHIIIDFIHNSIKIYNADKTSLSLDLVILSRATPTKNLLVSKCYEPSEKKNWTVTFYTKAGEEMVDVKSEKELWIFRQLSNIKRFDK